MSRALSSPSEEGGPTTHVRQDLARAAGRCLGEALQGGNALLTEPDGYGGQSIDSARSHRCRKKAVRVREVDRPGCERLARARNGAALRLPSDAAV